MYDSDDNSGGSDFGTKLTCIPSNEERNLLIALFPLKTAAIVIIFQRVQTKLYPGVKWTSYCAVGPVEIP